MVPRYIYGILAFLALFVAGEILYLSLRPNPAAAPTHNTTDAAGDQSGGGEAAASDAVPAEVPRAEGKPVLFVQSIEGNNSFLSAVVMQGEYFDNTEGSDEGAKAAYEDGVCTREVYERGTCLPLPYYIRTAGATTTVAVSPALEIRLVDTPGAYYPEGRLMDLATFRTLFRRSDYGDMAKTPFHFEINENGALTKLFEQYIP